MNILQKISNLLYEITAVLSVKQKKIALCVLLLTVINSFLELIGVAAVLPFIQAFLTPDALDENFFASMLFRTLGIQNTNMKIYVIALFLLLLYLFKNIFMIVVTKIRYSFSTNVQKDISVQMLRYYMEQPYEFFYNINSAEILRDCTSAPIAYNVVLECIFNLATEFLSIILICLFLIYTDWVTALGTMIIIALVMFCMIKGFKPYIKKAGEIYKKTDAEKYKAVNQAVHGIKEIKIKHRQNYFIENFDNITEEARKAYAEYNVINACPDRIIEGTCVCGLIGVICLRMLFDSDGMVAFVPKLAAFAMAAFKVLPSVGKIINRVNTIVYNRTLQHDIFTSIDSAKEYYKRDNRGDLKEIKFEDFVNDIKKDEFVLSVNNVVFSYAKSNKPVLNKISLTINKGDSIGIIGTSGAGKTTAIDMLLGLLVPNEGEILLNGHNIYNNTKEWAGMVGYVPQNIFLIDDTIRKNVAFGRKYIDDSIIWNVLEKAQIREYVESLPEGLDTVVGEQGIKLSGGQRQRIAIARALYDAPAILIMDEATAALDNDTEEAVISSIEALQGQITMIIVAHRLTTIRKCNHVYEIKDGVAQEIKLKIEGRKTDGKVSD